MMPRQQIEQHLNNKITTMRSLSGGMIAQVYQVDFIDGQSVVAKTSSQPDAGLDIEARMLQYLADNSDLPVPEVLYSDASLLIMSHIQNSGRISTAVEEDAAHYIAALHNITADKYGLPFDTLIGGLHQPNSQSDTWLGFFAEQRLIYMAQVAHESGKLPLSIRKRIDSFAAELDDFLIEPEQPSLIHGDLWGGNVLAQNQKIAGFVDPAIYYAHPEIELAFSTLFNTFGQTFFDAYTELRPLEPDFFTMRRDVYNLYPLLVHVRLFGGGYVSQVERTLKRFGY